MRTRHLRALSGLILLAAACTSAPVEPTAARRAEITAQVDSTIADLYEAMNAGDPARVLAHYLPTDEFLYASVGETLQGWKTFSQMAHAWYASHPGETFEYQVLHVQVLSEDAATVTASGGTAEGPQLLWTRMLVRRGGAWLVALEHESWPGAEPPRNRHPMS